MGEEALLQLVQQSLATPQGKSLLGDALPVADILNRIQELSTKYNIDLSALEKASEKEINLSLGSNLTREQRREKRQNRRLSRKEKIEQRKANLTNDVEKTQNRIREEISALKEKIKSQTPILQEYTITGRLQDKNTNTPLQGAKVTLGVNQDFVKEEASVDNPLNVSEELLPNKTSVDLNDLVFVPIPGQTTRTDKQGNFSIKVKVPIIPENQKTPLVFGLLYSKSGYVPGTQAIINGDKTIKTNLSLTSLINLREAAEEISQKFNDGIDLAQAGVAALAMDLLDKLIFAKKFRSIHS